MKFICLGYYDEDAFNALSEAEQHALMDECFAFDEELKKGGHFAGGEGLQHAKTAVTLSYRKGKVTTTDGPFAETKEQLGGILVLEARDMAHAIELMSRHPGVRIGPFEIRPAEDLAAMVAASEQRRRA